MIDLYFKMFISFVIVLVILGIFYLIIKKRLNINNTGSLFQILEYKSLGPKLGIMALKFSDKVLLLAITPTNISLIEQFDANTIQKSNSDTDDILLKLKKLKESLDESN